MGRIKIEDYTTDWIRMSREIFGHKLSSGQEKIIESVQKNRRTTARSGHACGKDFVAADTAL